MKYSLLIPTRNREDRFTKCLESIYKTTTQKKNLEILVAVDSDDTISQAYVKKAILQYQRQMEIQMHIRERSEFLNRDYYNWLGYKATGDLIWVIADDVILCEFGWDTKLSTSLEHFFENQPDRVVCVSLRDNTPPPSHRLPKFPCFPMFTPQAREATGWLLHPKVPTWGADYVSYCIYKPIGRLLEFTDCNYINHVSWHNKQVEVDETNKRIGEIFNKLKGIPEHNTDRIIAQETGIIQGQLRTYINNFKKKNEEVDT